MKNYCFLFLVIGCGGGPPFTSDKVGVNDPDSSPTAGSSNDDAGISQAGQMDIPDAGSMEDASGGSNSAGSSSAGSSSSAGIAGVSSSGGMAGTAGSPQGGMDAGLSGQGGTSGNGVGGTGSTAGSNTAGNSGSSGVGSSSGSSSCNTGDSGCACYGNSTCNGSLVCQSGLCIAPACKTLNGVPGQVGQTWNCSDQSVMTECIYQDIYKAFPSFAPTGWNGVAYRGIDCTNSKFHLLYATGGSCHDEPIEDFLNPQLTGMPNGCPYK